MTRVFIEQKKKPRLLDVTLSKAKDGIYLVDYDDRDYIIFKRADSYYGFCDNNPNEKGDYQSGILPLNTKNWKDVKVLYKITKLKVNYELEENEEVLHSLE